MMMTIKKSCELHATGHVYRDIDVEDKVRIRQGRKDEFEVFGVCLEGPAVDVDIIHIDNDELINGLGQEPVDALA